MGYEISQGGIGMVTEYIDKILQWPLPTTGKELQSFLGFCGYYQRSIREYGKLTAGLQELKMQTGPLIWTPQLRADFKDLKLCFKDRLKNCRSALGFCHNHCSLCKKGM